MTGWRKSSRCEQTNCVEVWPGYATVWVRDSTGQTLVVDRADWAVLVRAVKAAA